MIPHGQHVRWSGGMSGTVVGGPWSSADGRVFYAVAIDESLIPTIVAEVWIYGEDA